MSNLYELKQKEADIMKVTKSVDYFINYHNDCIDPPTDFTLLTMRLEPISR